TVSCGYKGTCRVKSIPKVKYCRGLNNFSPGIRRQKPFGQRTLQRLLHFLSGALVPSNTISIALNLTVSEDMPFNSIFPLALRSFIKERFNTKSQSKSRPNLLEEEDDWGTVSALSASTPNIFQEPMVTDLWDGDETIIDDDLVLDQLEVDNSGERFDWRESNFNGGWNNSDRVFAQAKRAGGKRRRIPPRRAGSEESLLDTEMSSIETVSSKSLTNLLECSLNSSQKKNATKRDACGHIVFKDDDWGFIKGLNYKARENEDIRKSKFVRK
ncbi:unnamed protein product, partial [Allacma fusca]